MTTLPRSLLFIIAALMAMSAGAQTPVRILSGFPPGGVVDIVARVLAERMTEALGRPVVVETKTGASGQLAGEALKAAASDGNTLMVTPDSNISAYPHTVKKPAYEPLKDFVAIAHTGNYDLGLAVHAGVTVSDFKQFVAWTNANPKDANYGTAGAGSVLHFFGLLIAETTGAKMVHVPYRGAGPAITDVTGGQVASIIVPLGLLVPNHKAGKIRLLATSGTKRSPAVPDIPTFTELGFPNLEAPGWFGLFGPAGMRPELVERYNDIIVRAMRTPAMRERMQSIDLEIRELSVAEFGALVKASHERWGPIIRRSGFTADSN
jgi:tripartite-type tricarboxylate transporter receptor subunit TctC